jgi:3D (Asp-Asp-Asp) domain-containing protein
MTCTPVAGLALAIVLLSGCGQPDGPQRHEPVVVTSPLRLDGVVVQGAKKGWHLASYGPPAYGDPVPVLLTSYCLRGTTRRGRYVRDGIVAADPRLFPLSRYIELYVGKKYYGRFLVDDTGRKIKGPHLDVWIPSCRDAKIFGVQRGTAVLVGRPMTKPSLEVKLAGAKK